MGHAKHHATKIQVKPVGGNILGFISNFNKCWRDVAGDVTSYVVIDKVGMGVCARFDDFRLNSGQIIGLSASLTDTFYALLCSI